ncbi:MarR family winged helix-turn-helix transcriptional regulator [uncultured Microbacterium sp.]|uniref:MarR family winged helix-turn-helix transcriptional regulator n=1 Tax=uncultured Microbacterium sp. TaxID=191216 RepID=UPI0035CA29CE
MQTDVLDEMVCFSLYAASRAVSQAYRAVLAESDLTYPQFLVLVSLHRSPGSTVSELGQAMHLDSGTLSPLLQRLEARGLLTRERHRDDERVVNVLITDAGHGVLATARGDVDCLSAEYGLERGEVGELLAKLHRIAENMTQLTASRRRTDELVGA